MSTDSMEFPTDLKVVKVADMGAHPGEESILLADNSTSENIVELPQKGGAPDNWPQIPQLSRRRSCETTWNRTNCVNKAVEHLQLLLNILTGCVQKVPGEKVPGEKIPRKKVPRKSNANRTVSIYGSKTKNKEHALVPLTTELVPLTCDKTVKVYKGHPQLKAVVNEVMLLLAWLLDDCQKTEARLDSERALCLQLSREMDEMSQQKVIDLKVAVQKGHELYKKRLYCSSKQNKGMHLLTVYNRRKIKAHEHIRYCLSKDITIKSGQIPLLQAKMSQQEVQTVKIQNAISEANLLLTETEGQQKELKSQYRQSVHIVTTAQYNLDLELNTICHQFNLVSAAGKKAEEDYHSMVQGIGKAKQQTEDNHREITILRVKLENRRTRSNSLTLRRKNEKDILVTHLCQTKKQKSEISRLESEIHEITYEYKLRLKELEDQWTLLDEEFRSLINSNHEKNALIEFMEARKATSQKQRIFYEENQKRISHEMVKMETQVSFAFEELRDIEDARQMARDSFNEEHDKMSEEEKSMLRIIHRLQNELGSENEISFNTAGRCKDMKIELRSVQLDAEEEKETHYIQENQWLETIKSLKEKLSRLKFMKEQNNEKLLNLEGKKKEMNEAFVQIITENEKYMENLEVYPIISEEKSRDVEMKLVEMSYEEDRMRDEIELMNEQRLVMAEDLVESQGKVDTIIEVTQELEFQCDTASNLLSKTKDRYLQALSRVIKERRGHRELMHDRRETLREILQKKEESLNENEQLASDYRRSQMTLCQRKQDYVTLSEETMRLKREVKDVKQEMCVNSKTYNSDNKYRDYRGLYQKSQLAYFVTSTDRSNSKLKQLESVYKAKLRKLGTALDVLISSYFKKREYFLPMITHKVS